MAAAIAALKIRLRRARRPALSCRCRHDGASCVGRSSCIAAPRATGVQDVAVNLAAERARIPAAGGHMVQALIATAVHKAGYRSGLSCRGQRPGPCQAQRQAAERQRFTQPGWALVLALPVFILEMGLLILHAA